MRDVLQDRRGKRLFLYLIEGLVGLFVLFLFVTAYFKLGPLFPDRFPKFVSFGLFLLLTAGVAAGLLYVGKYLERLDRMSEAFWLGGLFLAAFLLSTPLILLSDIQPASDYKTYYLLAEALSRGEIFIPDYVSVFPHTLGFPAFLSLVFRVFGPSVQAAQWTGAVLSACSVCLVYLVGRELAGKRVGALAALLWLLMPTRILYTLLVCTENLFNAAALLAFYLFARAVRARSVPQTLLIFGGAGVLFALLAAVRPNALILVIALLLLYWIFLPRDERLKLKGVRLTKAACTLLLLGCYLITSTACTLGVERAIGKEVAATKIGWNLYVGMNLESLGRWNAADSESFTSILQEQGAQQAQSTYLEWGKERLWRQLREGTILPFLVSKTAAMWCGSHEAYQYIAGAQPQETQAALNFPQNNKPMLLLCDGFYYVLLALAAVGVAVGLRRRRCTVLQALGCLVLLGTVALHLPFEAAMRYQNHVMLWLCLMAADGAARFAQKDGETA